MKNPDFKQPKVSFLNDPKLSEYVIDVKKNELRKNLVPLVGNFLVTNHRFKGKDARVTFSHEGVSSLVSIIDVSGEKFVLKIPLNSFNSSGEADFLKVWENVGVKTPHVLEEGMIGAHPYLLMEYVNAPLLMDAYSKDELMEKEIYFEMGSTLRAMHEPKAEGFGPVVDGKAKFSSFEDWIDSSKKFAYSKENSILGEEHGSLEKALAVLTEHINKNPRNSYCHSDFATNNIFATEPMTVFDPNPNFNNRYIDLARSVVKLIGEGVSPQQFINGYFKEEAYSKKVLHAAFLLVVYLQIPRSHKINKTDKLQKWQKYLIQNNHLLEE